MSKIISDDDLLRAAQNWQDQIRKQLEKKREYRGIRDSKGLDILLKPLEREIKKSERHPITAWQEIWRKIVGAELAELSRVKNFNNGFLKIEVDNSALKSEFESFYSSELTETLKEEMPTKKLRALKFVLSGK